ncbi:hypothetical protein HDU89_005678 [Geranomyces variabilis]|nr:hypothetical protein HDU89_005678 [Geranomyces variabilis]
MPVPQLPPEVIEKVLSMVSDAGTLLRLPAVCKAFAQIVNSKNEVFWENWKEANASRHTGLNLHRALAQSVALQSGRSVNVK